MLQAARSSLRDAPCPKHVPKRRRLTSGLIGHHFCTLEPSTATLLRCRFLLSRPYALPSMLRHLQRGQRDKEIE